MNYQLTASGVMAPIKALVPYDDRAPDTGRDFAAKGSYSLYALERMLHDCSEQPPWRIRAKLCAAYYDGKQLDEVRRWLLRQEDLDERVVNLIRPIVNSVLGQEARSRTDVRVEADHDDYADVAEVISARLKEAERETYAHQAVSNAYASMVKKGLGWLHVCRNADPRAYPYRFEDVPIDEIWWDWRGQAGTRLDERCRWLCRMRFVDLDEVIASMPEHRAVLERVADGWFGLQELAQSQLGEPDAMELFSAYENEFRFNATFAKHDWYDSARKMVKMIEVWYRVPAMAVMLKFPGSTRTIEYNERDQRHVQAVARGLVKIVKGVTSQVRTALYAGPHRLRDTATKRKSFPYIPMFAYRDDADGSPYGMIDGMIAPQDDYNDRRHRIQWMLKARQLTIDNDALDTDYNSIADIADNVNRPDLVAVLNANRKNAQHGFVIGNTLSLQKEQFDLLGIAEADVQKSAGRYGSNLGEAQVQSGVANSLLIEQGEQAMGEMNDNYVYARRTGFEHQVDLIREDLQDENIKVPVGQGRSRRIVVLNTWEAQPQLDDAGQPMMAPAVDQATGQPAVDPASGQPVMQPVMGPPMPKNMVADADITTGLAETPNTAAYRQQTAQQLQTVITALAGNAPALNIVTPAYIESSTLPNRQEVADDLRRATGVPMPGDRLGRQKAEAEQAKALGEAQQLAKEKELADVENKEADTELKRANTAKVKAEAQRLQHVGEADLAGAHLKNLQAAQSMQPDPDAQVDDSIAEAAGAEA
jgi:hypothetical protein